ITPQVFTPLPQVLQLAAFLRRLVERGLGHVFVRNRNAETRAELTQLLLVQFFLLVRDVASLARFAEAVTLDGGRENDGRGAAVLDGGLLGRVHLFRIVTATRQLL